MLQRGAVCASLPLGGNAALSASVAFKAWPVRVLQGCCTLTMTASWCAHLDDDQQPCFPAKSAKIIASHDVECWGRAGRGRVGRGGAGQASFDSVNSHILFSAPLAVQLPLNCGAGGHLCSAWGQSCCLPYLQGSHET